MKRVSVTSLSGALSIFAGAALAVSDDHLELALVLLAPGARRGGELVHGGAPQPRLRAHRAVALEGALIEIEHHFETNVPASASPP